MRCSRSPRRRSRGALSGGLLPGVLASTLLWLSATLAHAVPLDGTSERALDITRSQIGFTLRTRWGQHLDGHFPRWSGVITTLPGGAHRVRLTLATGEVEIDGSRTYTRLTRGPGFFDAERFPDIVFVSDPYAPALLRDGGELTGVLRIRGISQHERFRIEPADCARPAIDCDVIGEGDIHRSQYAVDRYGYAVSDRVRFTLRIRVTEPD